MTDHPPFRVPVATVDQLFNAPDVDPFSTLESEITGEAALERLLRNLQLSPLRRASNLQLVVALPRTEITADLEPQLAEAIRRYCVARIEDNRLQIRLSRKQHTFGLMLVTALSLLAIALALILVTTIFADSTPVVQGVIAGAACVFIWVIMWDPLEALLFDWAMPAREIHALERLMNMEVVVEAQG